MGKKIRAAGAVLWRPSDGGGNGIEVAVVHRPRYDDWSLPKGKLDEGESEAAAAAREVAEETGQACALGAFVTEVSYRLSTGEDKVVGYFAARATGGRFAPNDEVDEVRWLSPGKAAKLLSYQRDAEVLETFSELGTDLHTVLLVRHAKAGNRDGWVGDDDLRPLTDAGERQAEALTEQLRLFGPQRVFSAPRLRCVQTVRALAAELDVPVEHEELLSEEGYWGDPAQAVDRLLKIAADEGTAVISSQGKVIPDLVAALAGRENLAVDGEIISKKGSTWLLGFRSGGKGARLVTAHYLPPIEAN